MAPDSPDLTPSPWLRSEVIQNLSPWHFLSLFLPERENCFNVTLQQKFSVIYSTDTDTINNTTPDPESSLVKMSESGHFTVINLIKQCD